MKLSKLSAIFLAHNVFGIASAVTIGFDNLTGQQNDPYLGHTENGFSVTPLTTGWTKAIKGGAPPPSVYHYTVQYLAVRIATPSEGAYYFRSLQFGTSLGYPIDLSFLGKYKGQAVFSKYVRGEVADSSYMFAYKISDSNPVDEVFFSMNLNDGDGGGPGADALLDNIVFEPVPEPAGIVALILGAAGLVAAGSIRAGLHLRSKANFAGKRVLADGC